MDALDRTRRTALNRLAACCALAMVWLAAGMPADGWIVPSAAAAQSEISEPPIAAEGAMPAGESAPAPASPGSAESTGAPAESPAPAESSPPAESPIPTENPAPPESDPSADSISAPDSGALLVSPESIAARLKEIETADETAMPDKAAIVEQYRAAADELKLAAERTARVADFEKRIASVATRVETLRRDVAAPPTIEPALPHDATLSAVEQRLAEVEQQLAAARKTLTAREEEPQRRARRRLEIPAAMAEARTALDAMPPPANPASGEPPSPMVQAQRVKRAARRQALTAEIALLEAEQKWYEASSGELLKLERELASQSVTRLGKRVAELREQVNLRRHAETARQAKEARLAAIAADPAFRQLAEENSELAEERKQLAVTLESLEQTADQVHRQHEHLREAHKRVVDKVEAVGLTNLVGQMLRKQRSVMTSVYEHRSAIDLRHDKLAEIQLRTFDLEDALAELRDLDEAARRTSDSFPEPSTANTDDLRPLLQRRRDFLNALLEDYNTYFNKLLDLDLEERQLVAEADEYRAYIDERVLWIRSADPLSANDVRKAASAIAWLSDPASWWSAWDSAWRQMNELPALVTLAVLFIAALAISRRRLRRSIARWGSPRAGESGPHASLRRGIKTTLATLALALPTPALLWLSGWLVAGGDHVRSEFCEALGDGLMLTGVVLLPVLVTRQIVRRDGLAELHFGWPADALRSLRRNITWLAWLGGPLVALVAMIEHQSNEAFKESLGRAVFLAWQALLAIFLFRTLRPTDGALFRLLSMRPGSWLQRTASLVYVLLVATPVAVGTLAVFGYYYTALRLTWQLEVTLWLVIGLVVVESLLGRWLTAIYRRMAIDAAVRAARAAREEPAAASRATTTSPAVEEPEPEVDLETVDVQTRRLLNSMAVVVLAFGLFWVWSDVLPALRIFRQFELWAPAEGAAAVTLASLIQALVVGAMTIVAVKNIPGLLEAAILHRLPLDVGLRYAIVAVSRYALAIAGITIAAGAIGIGWPKVQWLVAAVTFGLGFGLQEIFANFVSGLIVLFERPIRVGDIVTVGEISGIVSRIRMRATTITDWDRKELIVPNKEFITSRLVNWTLSDRVMRIVIPVGIAYGSDTELAQRLLLKAAADMPLVLNDPPARAFFLNFGESSLNFELRVFVAQVDQSVPVRHELNVAIDNMFREAGIEIAFPKRDLRIRSVEALPATATHRAESNDEARPSSNKSRSAA